MADERRPLGVNLRRLRADAGLSVVALARRSGIARATLTQIEAGHGNPTLETLYAIANHLDAPLAELISTPPATPPPRLVRRGSGPHVRGAAVEAWLLRQTRGNGLSVEIYHLTVTGHTLQRSGPHPAGTREHVHLHTGTMLVGPESEPVELQPGDYVDYAADQAHVYRHLAGPVGATLVITEPRTPVR